jgi:hypothetical protein
MISIIGFVVVLQCTWESALLFVHWNAVRKARLISIQLGELRSEKWRYCRRHLDDSYHLALCHGHDSFSCRDGFHVGQVSVRCTQLITNVGHQLPAGSTTGSANSHRPHFRRASHISLAGVLALAGSPASPLVRRCYRLSSSVWF